MTSDWYEIQEGDLSGFELLRAILIADAPTLGSFLLEGLSDPAYLTSVLQKQGHDSLVEYIAKRRISSKLSIRVADFGEITAGRLIEAEEGLSRPIEKLRYKFNHDWSPHLTDVFAVRLDADEISAFAYCEVKAGTTPPASGVAADGYRALVKAWHEKVPEILHFTSERLWDANRQDEYERLGRAISSAGTMPQLLRLVLVFDELHWSDDEFDALKEALEEEATPTGTFRCYLVRRFELRPLIEAAYAQMAVQAQAR